MDPALLERISAARRTPKPRIQKRPSVTRTWLVKCAGNPLVTYHVTGVLEPTCCPACGKNITAELLEEIP